MSPTGRPSPIPPASLLKAVRRLMRPLVRLMMQNGLTFPVLAETLRRLYVEIAAKDLSSDPKARTHSRVSIVTGVHRKEIRRLLEFPEDTSEAPGIVTLASQIVARWVGAAPFIDSDGRPLVLARTASEASGLAPSFDQLVESITTDVRPRAVLDDLLGHGSVVMDSDDRVRLNIEAFIPRPGGEEQLFYFARNLRDHVAAAASNISVAEDPPFLDRSVHYDGLTLEQVRTLREFARAAATRVLLDVNRLAQELTDATPDQATAGTGRINFGVYVYDEDERPAAASDE